MKGVQQKSLIKANPNAMRDNTDEIETYRLWSVASTVLALIDERSHSIIAIPLGRRE
jgi:hypothetical protein